MSTANAVQLTATWMIVGQARMIADLAVTYHTTSFFEWSVVALDDDIVIALHLDIAVGRYGGGFGVLR